MLQRYLNRLVVALGPLSPTPYGLGWRIYYSSSWACPSWIAGGRQPLLIGGTCIMGLALAWSGWAFQRHASGSQLLAMILAYAAVFAATQEPVVWVVMAEIFSTRIRGRAVSIATVCLWASCYLVSRTFPVLSAATGSAVTFRIYAVSGVAAVLFIWRLVPETKGQSLEQIETFLNRNRPRPAGTL